MTFSLKVKEELCRMEVKDSCCRSAEIAAAIRVAGEINVSNDGSFTLRFLTENSLYARKLFTDIKEIYDILPAIKGKKNTRLLKNMSYSLRLDEPGKALLENSGIILGTSVILFEQFIPKNDCCVRSYVRGAFLSAGSISDPEKLYHTEIVCREAMIAEELSELLGTFSLDAKVVERKDSYVLYLKEGEDIVDFLNIIGAHQSLMVFENIRIMKEMRNNVNRIVNCETANIQKVVDASIRQIESIKLLKEAGALNSLPEHLKEIAYLRLENPDASLKELGEMLSKPIGKSGVNHRLRKLDQEAEKLRFTK